MKSSAQIYGNAANSAILRQLKPTPHQYNIKWGKTDELLEAYVARYNMGKPRTQQINGNAMTLAKELVRQMSRELLYHQAYVGALVPFQDTLPNLRTNNTYLADKAWVSPRTVRNLRKRLENAGIITAYKYRGQNAQYELAINPEVLFIDEWNQGANINFYFMPSAAALAPIYPGAGQLPASTEAPASEAQNEKFATYSNQLKETIKENYKLSGADFPQVSDNHGVSGNTGVENMPNPVESPVENPQNQQQRLTPKQETIEAGNTHTQAQPAAGTNENCSENNLAPGAATKKFVHPPVAAPDTLAEATAHLRPEDAAKLRNMVALLWACAKENLWHGQYFTPEEAETAKARLAEYFAYSSPDRWDAGMREVARRMVLVRLWIMRGARSGVKRWLRSPQTYLDVRTQGGFVATKAWYKNDQQAVLEIQDRAQLTKATKEYTAAASGADGAASVHEVYKKWQQRLGKRSKELLDMFHLYIVEMEKAPAHGKKRA